jgi:hypothetical protein
MACKIHLHDCDECTRQLTCCCATPKKPVLCIECGDRRELANKLRDEVPRKVEREIHVSKNR